MEKTKTALKLSLIHIYLPIPLVGKFAALVGESSSGIKSAALGIDVRSGEELSQLAETLDQWDSRRFPYEILFLDASDETLIKRYKETRRSHPLAGRERLDRGIAKELSLIHIF